MSRKQLAIRWLGEVGKCSDKTGLSAYGIVNGNHSHSVTNEVTGGQYICGGTRHD